MATITKINASYSCKKQIRQYEPVEVFMGAEATLTSEEANDPALTAKAQQALFDTCKWMVDELVAKLGGR